MIEYKLTTIDNKFDPFTQYDLWHKYDCDMGYYTDETVARIAATSVELSDDDYQLALQQAMIDLMQAEAMIVIEPDTHLPIHIAVTAEKVNGHNKVVRIL